MANLERFTALGLDVALTEVDVTASSSSPSAQEQTQQANVYKNTVAACKQVEKCVGVTIWGYDDNYSWLSTKAPLPWYQPGGPNTALVRKSLYDGIVAGWGGASASSTKKSSNTPQTYKTGTGASNTTQTPPPASGANTHSWGFGKTGVNTPGTVKPANGMNLQN